MYVVVFLTDHEDDAQFETYEGGSAVHGPFNTKQEADAYATRFFYRDTVVSELRSPLPVKQAS